MVAAGDEFPGKSGPWPKTFMRNRISILTAALSTLAFLGWLDGTATACETPVFRYALERWASDPYELIVFHRGPLAEKRRSTLAYLRQKVTGDKLPLNAQVRAVDLADPQTDTDMSKLWSSMPTRDLPRIAVCRPGRLAGSWAWSCGLTRLEVDQLVDSPTRREIARRILAGDSAVWVLLDGSDKKLADDAAKTLQKALSEAVETLELNPTAVMNAATTNSQDGPPLKIAFSTIRLSRGDPTEQPLVSMLLRSEVGLVDEKFAAMPMAFPIFGRGRALYALVGKGINPQNIAEACAFMVGDCSCEIKDLNPGVDILMTVNWEAGIGGSMISPEPLPPLTGVHAPPATRHAIAPVENSPALDADASRPLGMLDVLGVVLTAIVVLVGIVTVVMVARRDREAAGGTEPATCTDVEVDGKERP